MITFIIIIIIITDFVLALVAVVVLAEMNFLFVFHFYLFLLFSHIISHIISNVISHIIPYFILFNCLIGVGGLYTGIVAQVVRDIPFYASFFGSYDIFCRLLKKNTTWNDTSIYFVSGG